MAITRLRICRIALIGSAIFFMYTIAVQYYFYVQSKTLLDSSNWSFMSKMQQSQSFSEPSSNFHSNSEKFIECNDNTPKSYYGQREKYWVLHNYIKATKHFKCDESITYTTHCDWTFLDNLIPLLERWQGPLSLAMYAPGTDFEETLRRIMFLRECQSTFIVKELVTFHIVFDQSYTNMPQDKVPSDIQSTAVDCRILQDTLFLKKKFKTFRNAKQLLYPVNVLRNVARDMATTFYVLPSDIELYPNPNLISDFLQMVRVNRIDIQRPTNKIFVVSIFEVKKDVPRLPDNKKELISMLKKNTTVPFHKFVCRECHNIPKAQEWLNAPFEKEMKVFHVGKRHRPYHHWEPIFIGTKYDPIYDERLTWEGRSDKMTQSYVLCLLDYEFNILNNAFLIHRPGIKIRQRLSKTEQNLVKKQLDLISNVVFPELKKLYGTKSECFLW